MARTVTEPSASTALPGLLSMNSPEMCSVCGFAACTWARGIVALWIPAKIAMPISRPSLAGRHVGLPGRKGLFPMTEHHYLAANAKTDVAG
jgi:hypothetical protein